NSSTYIDGVVDKIVGGGTPSRDIPDYYVGTIPWFTVKDMDGSFYMGESQEYINENAIKDSTTNLIEANNVIIATRIALGKGFVNTREITINQDLKALYLNEHKVNKCYFLYWYLHKKDLIKSMGSGSTVKGIRLEQLREFKLPVPPLIEQQKIAEILSKVDEQIENTEKLIEKTKELKKGLMQKLLTKGIGHREFKKTELGEIPVEWEVKKIGELAMIDYGISEAVSQNTDHNIGIPIITGANIGLDGKLDTSKLVYIERKNQERFKLNVGDLLFNWGLLN
ncbi:restriction endonuclease subunit S, partial [Bacillus cereus]|nr:restriction endonuclease subunit S [Bacillus cereus]